MVSHYSPPAVPPTEITITPWSLESLGVDLAAIAQGAPASAVWPVANLGIFVPFVIPQACIVVKMFHYNGTSAGNTLDVGIYNEDFTKVVSTGAVTQSGTSALQERDIADTVLAPGRYYMAISSNSATTNPTLFRANPAAPLLRAFGVFQQASVATLPSPATPAAMASAFLPYFGITLRTLV